MRPITAVGTNEAIMVVIKVRERLCCRKMFASEGVAERELQVIYTWSEITYFDATILSIVDGQFDRRRYRCPSRRSSSS